MAVFSVVAFLLGELDIFRTLSISPMIIGILLGMVFANTLRDRIPASFAPGIAFTSKRILRLGIILYGFRLTLQDVTAVGLPAVVIDAIIVTGTIFLGIALGRMLKMDRGIALLTSVGAAICGAAAVLGAESAIKVKPYKTAVAVTTVVIFGTLSMFLYPILYRAGIFDLSLQAMGIYTGATLHEVAHVVGAGNAMGEHIASTSIIVKMIRVMMLVPVLLVLVFSVARAARKNPQNQQSQDCSTLQMPWFALFFLLVIVLNSCVSIPALLISQINLFDTFLLTMAMTALGSSTSIDQFKKAGAKPFALASLLYIWLLGAGYILATLADKFCL